ncbi:MAG: bifunctional 2-polyprenyl-6-hydroxyphenol methylase/3-demethylubiquinol 3-O-methyltransferase UbiG [Gammaproteobacteria bacterium]|nr:bifunctional 2-polyprenyl-6-hydroxyphenol methylase/3-demethylubiquinol 3-O-methyltransferase UbiG [Gammaproteobacteria bacterium]
MTAQTQNVDPQEIAKFEELASRWWDPGSEFKPLHDINPLRLDYIDNCAELVDKKVLDVGCGGGILAESMALRGAQVTGIDMGSTPLSVARMHLHESGADVDYRQITAEDMAKEQAGSFDIITCMEMLEHVPDPSSIVQACSQLIKPGGHVFFSTLNRNPKSYLLAVLGAEYLLNLLPKGTHDYQKFIRPSELEAWSRKAGLSFNEIVGMTYNPFTRTYRISEDTDVNYIVHAQRSS